MNDLLERLFELEPSRRAIVYGVLLLVVGVLFWRFFYSPNAVIITERTERFEALELESKKKTAMAARLEEFRARVKELDAQLAKAIAQLPDEKEIPDLLSTVSSLGRESGLEIVLFRQKPEVLQEFYAEVPVEMLMRGSYRQVGDFVEAVGELNRIVNVGNISMRNPVIREDLVSIDTACTAVTFRFLSEEERARIAVEKAAKEK